VLFCVSEKTRKEEDFIVCDCV